MPTDPKLKFAALIFSITLLYVFYYFQNESNPVATMRFLLPTFLIYSIAAFWGLEIVSKRWRKTAMATTVALLIVNAIWGTRQNRTFCSLSVTI